MTETSDTDIVKKRNLMPIDRLIERGLMVILVGLLLWTSERMWDMSKVMAVHSTMLENHNSRLMTIEGVTSDLKALAVRMDVLREGQLDLKKTLDEHMKQKK